MSGTVRYDAAVIGGGAAGLLAAGLLGERVRTVLLEPGDRLGAKLRITGKGRCNLTNACTPEEFLKNVVTNGRFLYSAVNRFSPTDTMAFFERLGVPLKTERGNRVFPTDDNAHTVANALADYARRGCDVVNAKVTSVTRTEQGFAIGCADGQTVSAARVVIATGGKSYPTTGSTGDGYAFARSLGHTVAPLRASLVPLVCAQKCCRDMMGLSLKNVTLSLLAGDSAKPVYSEQGEMLFTHFGVSGPLVLSASAHLGDAAVRGLGGVDALLPAGKIRLEIDLKPALPPEKLDARLVRDFADPKNQNKDFRNYLRELVPTKMIGTIVTQSGIPGTLKVNSVTREQRRTLVELLKHFGLTVTGTRPIDEAVVTAGGVCVDEVSPATMQSKRTEGLYFAGEVLDLDAYTGGFNLQIAFSTAFCAARDILEKTV